MPIEIYPNRLEARPIETHRIETRTTIAAFLDQLMTGGYRVGEALPLSAWVNDERVPQEDWGEFVFLPKDHVRLHIEPRGIADFVNTAILFAGVKAVFGMLMPKLPGTPSTPGQGESLAQGSARGNKVKLGDPVREIAGRMKVFPDYLVAPHKYFQNFTEQWTELGLCVGVGKMQILAANVKIGDTALIALGADAEYRIFQPDEAVSGYSAFNWWHTAPEVGASSTGAAGLELTAATTVTPAPSATSFTFSGYSIFVAGGGEMFPTDWAAGLILRVVAPYEYSVTTGGVGGRNIITGPLSMLNPTVGDTVEVAGINAGRFTVHSYDSVNVTMTLDYLDGSPATDLILGTGNSAIGPDGLRFKILSRGDYELVIERLDESGASDLGFPGFIALTPPGASVRLDASNYESGWRGPFAACPEGEKTTLVELDFFYPEGLCGVGREGQIYAMGVTYEVQWREVGTAPWNSQVISDSNATLNQGGYTHAIATGSLMRPEFRVRKISPLEENLEFHDRVEWYGLRALLSAPAVYPGVTCLGVKVRTSDRISAQTESRISVVATRILPRRTGGEGPTRSLADFAAYIPRSLGQPDSLTNFDELYRLGEIWDERGDTFDMEYDSETTSQQALQDVFGAGFSELTLERGQITPVRDSPRTQFEQMYTPQNLVGSLKRTPKLVANPDEFDGVDVTFMDAETWTESTVKCRLPGDAGTKVEKVTVPGVTDRTKAYQLGMRRRRVHRYRIDSFEWATEGDALVSRYMGYCAVADDVSGYPQSALLEAYDPVSKVITVSEPFLLTGAPLYGVLIRRPDGSVSGSYEVSRIDDFKWLLSVPLDFLPDTSWGNAEDPPHVLFGALERICYPVLITQISPNGMSSARVEAVGYDSRVYLDDDSPLP